MNIQTHSDERSQFSRSTSRAVALPAPSDGDPDRSQFRMTRRTTEGRAVARSAEARVRRSAEGASSLPRRRPRRATLAAQLLQHSLTSPEKKTLKRIERVRREVLPIDLDGARAKITELLRADRGLEGNVTERGYGRLVDRLVDFENAKRPAATLIGDYLRTSGATERSPVSPMRVKAALRELNLLILDADRADEPLPRAVREFRLEKRDGGLQIVGHLFPAAQEEATLAALRAALKGKGYGDVSARVVPSAV